jgi:dihydrofolate reductase
MISLVMVENSINYQQSTNKDMGKLSVFNFITLNGYFKGPNDDTNWHQHGNEEEGDFAAEGAQSDNIILFGRKTYEMMAGFWPTTEALKIMPDVAKGMNKSEKIVFSRTLKKAEWNNTRVISNNIADEVKKLKTSSKKDMTILGSGSILTQLVDAGLVDSFQFMVDPIALGEGTPIFNGIKHKLDLKLTSTRPFKSGAILLSYESVNS